MHASFPDSALLLDQQNIIYRFNNNSRSVVARTHLYNRKQVIELV